MKTLKRNLIYSLIASCLILLTGCVKMELYSNLEESEANDMIAILMDKGIDVDKVTGKEETYMISVNKEDFAVSVDILTKYGYPRSEYQGVGEMFQKSGLVSTPSEERIRFMFALSQELEKTISHIEGVVNARVHIVLPENNPFMEKSHPASASVSINYRQDSDVENYVPRIKNLVMNSIEGLDYDKISLVLFPADINESAIRKRVNNERAEGYALNMEMILVGGVVGFFALFGGLYTISKVFRRKKSANVSPPKQV